MKPQEPVWQGAESQHRKVTRLPATNFRGVQASGRSVCRYAGISTCLRSAYGAGIFASQPMGLVLNFIEGDHGPTNGKPQLTYFHSVPEVALCTDDHQYSHDRGV